MKQRLDICFGKEEYCVFKPFFSIVYIHRENFVLNLFYLKGCFIMKKFKKILSAVSAGVLCALPMINGVAVNAADSSKMKTYVIYNVATRPDIAYFDFTLDYDSDVIAEKSVATDLCNWNFFYSIDRTAFDQVRTMFDGNGYSIGDVGILTSTKFIVPMDTKSIYDKVTYSNAVVRNANGVTLAPTSIIMNEILLGDVNQDGRVEIADSTLILQHITNPNGYQLTDKGMLAADVNRDGVVDKADALLIQQYDAGVIKNF